MSQTPRPFPPPPGGTPKAATDADAGPSVPAISQAGTPTSDVPAGAPGTSTPGISPSGTSMTGGPPPRGFERRPAQPTLHPRRVVGGIRLQTRGLKPGEQEGPPAPSVHWTWASARWMRLCELHAPGDQLAEGLEYARGGQTRQLDVSPGAILARVQGRMPTAYKVAIRLPTFTPEQWETVTSAMVAQAKYGAALLAGELPTNIEDLFAPAGLHLFPPDLSDLSVSCDCEVFRRRSAVSGSVVGLAAIANRDGAPAGPSTGPSTGHASSAASSGASTGGTLVLCKHLCCAMYLVAERLAQQQMLIFGLRGMLEADLVERLRTQRALAGLQRSGGSAAPVYTPHLPATTAGAGDLAAALHTFWDTSDPADLAAQGMDGSADGGPDAGPASDALAMPIEPPAVTHPLLRRLGSSPLAGSKFPLVGLLATCYDVISESMIREAQSPTDPPGLDAGASAPGDD